MFEVIENSKLFLESYLGVLMDSSEGKELQKALEDSIAEERECLKLFRVQIGHCQQQKNLIDRRISEDGPTRDNMAKRRAFEEEQTILNVAGLAQQCNFETKGLQLLLYFQKNVNIRARIAVEASVMMYEWCEKLLGVSGKQFQDMAKRLLSQSGFVRVNVARKKVSDFFKKERTALHKIRNNVGAHRDDDFMKQMEVIDEVGWSDTIARFHEFEKATLEFGKSLQPLMDAGLRQISASFDGGR